MIFVILITIFIVIKFLCGIFVYNFASEEKTLKG